MFDYDYMCHRYYLYWYEGLGFRVRNVVVLNTPAEVGSDFMYGRLAFAPALLQRFLDLKP